MFQLDESITYTLGWPFLSRGYLGPRLGNNWGRRRLAAVSSCPANSLGLGIQLALNLPPIRRSMAQIVVNVLSPCCTVGVRLLNRVIH